MIELDQIGPSRQYDVQKWIVDYKDVDENGEDLDFAMMGVIDGHCSYDWCEVLWKLEVIEDYRNRHGYRTAA